MNKELYQNVVTLMVLSFIIFIVFFIRHKKGLGSNSVENFVDAQKNLTGTDVFDPFYASIYDQLFYMEMKNTFELKELQGYFLSQHKNKDKALKVLCARIKDQELADQQKSIADTRKTLIGSGDRSERISTYIFPQGRVTDLRIKFT